MDLDQSIVTLPARKEFGADDIALYQKVRIYDNISFFTPEADEVGSVSNVTSKEEREITLNGMWGMLFPQRPKKNKLMSWFWFCCQCEGGGYNLKAGPQFCTAQNCNNHLRCSNCRCEKHRKDNF